MFILGCSKLLVTVDHKHLIKIFLDKTLENIKKNQVFSLKEHSLMYKFYIKHLSGKHNVTLDCTSRYSAVPRHDGTTSKDSAQMINSGIKASFNSPMNKTQG